MHFEILVEDQSGKKALDILVPKIIGDQHTFRVHPYKGIGRIPVNLRGVNNASKQTLLDSLPKMLRAYGKTFEGYGLNYPAAVIVVCDLDDKCLKIFLQELQGVLTSCDPQPVTRFCIAIEEGEAWYLGDMKATKMAYPKAKASVLKDYVNDSICGTWELLADAIYPGGSHALKAKGWMVAGSEKSKWAEEISPHMDITHNLSPSFCHFRDKLQELAGEL